MIQSRRQSEEADEDGAFTAISTLSNEDEYDAYIQAVRDAGFDRDAEEQDLSGMGMDMRTFTASHSDGRIMTLTLTGGSLMIEIGR